MDTSVGLWGQLYYWLHFQLSLLCVFLGASRLEDTPCTVQEKEMSHDSLFKAGSEVAFSFENCDGTVLIKLSVVNLWWWTCSYNFQFFADWHFCKIKLKCCTEIDLLLICCATLGKLLNISLVSFSSSLQQGAHSTMRTIQSGLNECLCHYS